MTPQGERKNKIHCKAVVLTRQQNILVWQRVKREKVEMCAYKGVSDIEQFYGPTAIGIWFRPIFRSLYCDSGMAV